MNNPSDAQAIALVQTAEIRRADVAARLQRAVRHKRNNPELSFHAVARVFHVGEDTIRKAMK